MSTESSAGQPAHGAAGGRERFAGLALGALGVVYGDIGTSPLYALKECFKEGHGVAPTHANVLGLLSLFFWSLIMVVVVKYLVFIVRADNRGEGGIFALLALVPQAGQGVSPRLRTAIMLAAAFGAALLYGDGIITPAISVLAAMEGLNVATPAAAPFVIPAACGILLGLFLAQKRGTGGVGKVFGPIMLAWFVTIGALGLVSIVRNPAVLAAVSPHHAVEFFLTNRFHGFAVLGAVVLCITGGEALYADLGHFGRAPIRAAWFGFAFPALLLSYFGQGAHVLQHPESMGQPFFALVPRVLIVPMVVLAAAATVIASQALISGAYSITRQAIQFGFLPRMTIIHTSGQTEGQVYVPAVNSAMMVACIGLVLAFRESTNLAAAYGLAVTTGMLITSLVFFCVITRTWHWPRWRAVPLVALFLVFDCAYWGANLLKFMEGGWLPVLVAAVIFTVMLTWRTGRAELAARMARVALPVELLLQDLSRRKLHRVSGTAVFMAQSTQAAPPALLHHLKHVQVLHQKVVLLAVEPAEVPTVRRDERLKLETLTEGFYRLTARYGFMETPDVPQIMRDAGALGLATEASSISYFLSRESLLTKGKAPMAAWRKSLFSFISRNARPAGHYFGLPPGRVIELGIQVEL